MEQITFNVNFDIQDSTFYRHQALEGASIDIFINNVTLSNISILRGLAVNGGAGMDVNIYSHSDTISLINATGLIFECNYCQQMNSPKSGVALNTRFDNPDGEMSNSQSLILLHSCTFQSSNGYSSLGIVFSAIVPQHISYVEIFNCTFLDTYPLQTQFSVFAQSNYTLNPVISIAKSTVVNSNVWLNSIDLNISDVIFVSSKLWALNSTIVYTGNVTLTGRSGVKYILDTRNSF